MLRADKLKAKSVRDKEKQESEMKQLLQTLKFASASEATEDQRDARDGTLGGLQPTPKKGYVSRAIRTLVIFQAKRQSNLILLGHYFHYNIISITNVQ